MAKTRTFMVILISGLFVFPSIIYAEDAPKVDITSGGRDCSIVFGRTPVPQTCITIQSTNDNFEIREITANRGNCDVSYLFGEPIEYPIKLKYGQAVSVKVCKDILELKILTSADEWTAKF